MLACDMLGVAQGKIKKLEDIFLFSMPIKEYQIVEFFLGSVLKDEVMKIMPVQKQTRAGQRTRFKVRRQKGCCNIVSLRCPTSTCALHALTRRGGEGEHLVCLLQAFVVVGDHNGHVGLGVKCAKEVTAQPSAAPHQANRIRHFMWSSVHRRLDVALL